MATGTIKNPLATTVGTTITNYMTAASGVTLTEGKFAQCGKMASIYIHGKCSSAITVATGKVIGTLKSGYLPVIESPLNLNVPVTDSTVYINDTNGEIKVLAAVSANADFYIEGSYLLP